MPLLPAVERQILDLSQPPGQRFLGDGLLLPRQAYLLPSSFFLKRNKFEHWDIVDGCPSRVKCAVSRREVYARSSW